MTDVKDLMQLFPGAFGLRFYHRLIRNLILPNNAGPSQPRLVLGPDLPAQLVAFYSPNTVIACMLAYSNAVNYQYTAWLQIAATGETVEAQGQVYNGSVYEMMLLYFDPSSGGERTITIGDAFGTAPGVWPFHIINADITQAGNTSFSTQAFNEWMKSDSSGLIKMIVANGKDTQAPGTAYTPSATNIIVGNGTLIGKWEMVAAKFVRVWGRFDVGSTSAFSGPDVTMRLPAVPSGLDTFVSPSGVGTFLASDSSAGQTFPGICALFGNIIFMVAKQNNWSGSNPFIPAVGDNFLWDITYEIP